MESKVVYSVETKKYLRDLVYFLFQNEYFGFEEDAKNYVDRITFFIEESISTYPSKTSPEEFKIFGEKFMLYKANAQTTWYIFFDCDEDKFLIKFITNNHTDFIKDFNL